MYVEHGVLTKGSWLLGEDMLDSTRKGGLQCYQKAISVNLLQGASIIMVVKVCWTTVPENSWPRPYSCMSSDDVRIQKNVRNSGRLQEIDHTIQKVSKNNVLLQTKCVYRSSWLY